MTHTGTPMLLILAIVFLFPSALAHSGGTDANGCHTNHKTGDYHCHGSSSYSDYPSYGVDYSPKPAVSFSCEGPTFGDSSDPTYLYCRTSQGFGINREGTMTGEAQYGTRAYTAIEQEEKRAGNVSKVMPPLSETQTQREESKQVNEPLDWGLILYAVGVLYGVAYGPFVVLLGLCLVCVGIEALFRVCAVGLNGFLSAKGSYQRLFSFCEKVLIAGIVLSVIQLLVVLVGGFNQAKPPVVLYGSGITSWAQGSFYQMWGFMITLMMVQIAAAAKTRRGKALASVALWFFPCGGGCVPLAILSFLVGLTAFFCNWEDVPERKLRL